MGGAAGDAITSAGKAALGRERESCNSFRVAMGRVLEAPA